MINNQNIFYVHSLGPRLRDRGGFQRKNVGCNTSMAKVFCHFLFEIGGTNLPENTVVGKFH